MNAKQQKQIGSGFAMRSHFVRWRTPVIAPKSYRRSCTIDAYREHGTVECGAIERNKARCPERRGICTPCEQFKQRKIVLVCLACPV